MARRDPLLPNTGIIARREYRDRVRSPLFIASTIVLMGLALSVALAPIALRYFDRQTVTRIAIVATDDGLAAAALGVTDSLLNTMPAGVDPDDFEKPFEIERADDAATADRALANGVVGGVMVVERLPSGQLDVVYRTSGPPNGVRSQLVGFAAIGLSILDWTGNLPKDNQLAPFQPPRFGEESISAPIEEGTAIDPVEVASRSFLGTVFIVLMLITILIYGMWVATGVATEKSSRVMELMISAASPRQMVIGKVTGIGGAGLTQYVAIVIPALLVLAFQDQIALAVLGPAGLAGTPIGGLTIGLLVAYGVFFLGGFALFAFVYAAAGSFVSRPDDLQTLSLPLSLLAMAGYVSALLVLLGGGGTLSRIASIVPPFSPFAMFARLVVGRVEPWELALSVGLLIAAIIVVALAAIRIYTAGVLLYGQRPGLRAFISAARRAG